MSLQINNTGFKAAAAPVSYNNRYTPPMSEENVMNDIFLMQQAEQQKASKREKSRDRWGKANTIAQFGIAAGFISSAIIAFLALKFSKAQAAGKLDSLKDKSVLKFKEIECRSFQATALTLKQEISSKWLKNVQEWMKKWQNMPVQNQQNNVYFSMAHPEQVKHSALN